MVVSRETCVPSLMSVTVTPGMTPPASLTEPRRPPVNVWADAVLTTMMPIHAASSARRNRGFRMVDSSTDRSAVLRLHVLYKIAGV